MDLARYASERVTTEVVKAGPIRTTIVDVIEKTYKGKNNGPDEVKPAIVIADGRCVPMGPEILKTLIEAFQSSESDDWKGKSVEIYFDPTIKFGGKKVGGVRVRPLEKGTPLTADSIPF